MKLYLAPMEGVVDSLTRDVLTQIGGIDQCVTEFIRVTNQLIPDKVFYRYAPELKTESKTRAGTPVFVQLLGGDPICLSENAVRAVELGACGIDLNFGCPAKTVNRHDGGATLLLYPDRLLKIVETIRRVTPGHIPVTAKIRLGFSDPTTCLRNAEAIEAGGADRLTIHCRTKLDLYRPPAFWEWLPLIREKVKMPLVANGEIWNLQDFQNCKRITGCEDFMIGRAVFQDPFLFRRIRGEQLPDAWPAAFQVLSDFFDLSWIYAPRFAQSRTKQWLKSLTFRHQEAKELFDQLKVITQPDIFREQLKGQNFC